MRRPHGAAGASAMVHLRKEPAMDAHPEQIGSALRLEAQRSTRASWGRLVHRVARWIGRPFAWLA